MTSLEVIVHTGTSVHKYTVDFWLRTSINFFHFFSFLILLFNIKDVLRDILIKETLVLSNLIWLSLIQGNKEGN